MIIGQNLEQAGEFLRAGQLVAIPTETVYGLAGNGLDPQAVVRIYEAKNRPAFDPLILHIASLDVLPEIVSEIPEKALLLAERLWPGPLTLVLPRKPVVPDIVTSGLDTVAVRIPDHPLTLELLKRLDFPLAAPSANPFGYISPTKASHVAEQLSGSVAYILDGGDCQVGLESTIIGFPEGIPTAYRLGGLTLEAIESVAGPVQRLPHSTSNPKAPGMLQSHYAPRKPFLLSHRSAPGFIAGEDTGYLLFSDPLPGVAPEKQRILSPTGNLQEAAQYLFSFLRELDKTAAHKIHAEKVPDEGLGKAINDRLLRAAAVRD